MGISTGLITELYTTSLLLLSLQADAARNNACLNVSESYCKPLSYERFLYKVTNVYKKWAIYSKVYVYLYIYIYTNKYICDITTRRFIGAIEDYMDFFIIRWSFTGGKFPFTSLNIMWENTQNLCIVYIVIYRCNLMVLNLYDRGHRSRSD